MIIEELAKLQEHKRISAAVLAALTAACICYFAITRGSVVKLQAARAKYAGIRSAHAGAEDQQADFLHLQRRLEDTKQQIEKQQQRCFSSEQAVHFFENINAMALVYNLKPISRIVSEPEKLVVDEETKAEEQFLQTQSAEVVVAGNYSDIVGFVNELTGRPQKVCITELRITLPPGKMPEPRASFSVSVLIDALGTGSEIDRQSPVTYPTALRDPMQFCPEATATQTETKKLIIRGILYSEDNPSAVIDDRIVREGDEISGASIVKINQDSVEFEMNGKKWVQKVQR